MSVCVLLVAFLVLPEDVVFEYASVLVVLEGMVVVFWDANFRVLGSTETGLQVAYAMLILPSMSTTIV
jgi:hypothetical protein